MSYTHILCNRGAVHAQTMGSDYTVCGKWITHRYDEVSDLITCKVCVRSIELSRDWRIAHKLSELVHSLYNDMEMRPGAYLHADCDLIRQMKRSVEDE